MALKTIWSGSMRDVYLCVRDPQPPVLRVRPLEIEPPIVRPYRFQDDARAAMLQVLPERPVWRVRDLRARLNLERGVLNGLLHRARQARVIRSVGHGRVAYRRRRTEAA